MTKGKKFVAYYRVSTAKQGVKGLGIGAQKEAVRKFVQGGSLIAEYTEQESGKRDDRPQLASALEHCKRVGAILVISRLDRLSRNLAFITSLQSSGVEFICCDMPAANKLTIHVLGAVAEAERDMISTRTKEALKEAKARGVQLGNPDNLSEQAKVKGRILGRAKQNERADKFAALHYQRIISLREEGQSYKYIAEMFNRERILTSRGLEGSWTAATVRRLLKRAKTLKLNGR